MKRLRSYLPVIQEEENFLYLDMKKSFSEKDFFCWLESCCSEGKKQETVEIKTLVSDLVPKDEFIPDSMSSFARNFKRITDCIVALITMVVFSPLALCCYIAIKLEDGALLSSNKNVLVALVARSIFTNSDLCAWMQKNLVHS